MIYGNPSNCNVYQPIRQPAAHPMIRTRRPGPGGTKRWESLHHQKDGWNMLKPYKSWKKHRYQVQIFRNHQQYGGWASVATGTVDLIPLHTNHFRDLLRKIIKWRKTTLNNWTNPNMIIYNM